MLTYLLESPCVFCGYHGEGFYQPGTHDKQCLWFEVGGLTEREEQFRTDVRRIVVAREAANARISELEARLAEAKRELGESRSLYTTANARADAAERALCTEQAEHTREVLLHAVTKSKLTSAEAEVARLKPVVDAVIAYFDAENPYETECWVALSAAVREYRKAAAALQDASAADDKEGE